MIGMESIRAAAVYRHAPGVEWPSVLEHSAPLYIQLSVPPLSSRLHPFATEGRRTGGVGRCSRSLSKLPPPFVRMNSLKRKRVEAPRIPTLEDVHPYTTWNICVRIYHKFHVERFAVGRTKLNMVLLDEKGKKMAAVIYDDEVDRFETLLVEGRVYYVWRMSAEPIMRNQESKFADSSFLCRFTTQTTISELTHVNEQLIPLYPPFMPFERVWPFAFDNDKYIEVIGMVIYVSSLGFVKDKFYKRNIPVRNIVLLDSSYNMMKIVLWDKYVTDNMIALERCADERAIVIATMLRAKPIDRELHTTDFSRVRFNPDIAAVRELRRRSIMSYPLHEFKGEWKTKDYVINKTGLLAYQDYVK
ncbi:hypothetical protein ACP70R_015307 [Stipagrostis hirtigluma subsp. patula]